MNFRKLVIVSDTHGSEIDRKAEKLFREFCGGFKADMRLHLGDFMNCEALRTGADEHERRIGLRDDRAAAITFLEWYNPTHVLWGNHDDRLAQYVKYSPGPMADYCSEIIASVHAATPDAVHLPYDKRKGVLKLGKLKALHGFFAGSNAGKQTAMAYGSCVFGHTHRFSSVSVPGAHSGGRAVARGTGCLCHLDLDYNARHVDTLSQGQGWLYGVMNDRGEYWLSNAEIVNGKVAIADNFKVLS